MDKKKTNDHGNAVSPPDADDTRGWLSENGPALLIVAAMVGFFLYRGVDLTVVGMVAVGLGFVIFIHELGHFVAAKWCDVHVETFSIGFGPALPYCQHKWGETTYKIGLIPLGGYVKMLGEGAESEDGEDDPRSYKNKSVGQRMVIISAGVFMNMVLAVVGFVAIYMGPGVPEIAGVVGQVDAGSPAWEAGLRAGAVLNSVGGAEDPFFSKVKTKIAFAGSRVSVPITFTIPGETEPRHTTIEPRYEGERVGQKLIGIAMPATTTVRGFPRLKIPPYVPGSPASAAAPPLNSLDIIIGSTVKAGVDAQVVWLDQDPRNPDPDSIDFFQLHRRMVDLAGLEMRIAVRREGSPTPVEITVPPAFAPATGLIMEMGHITAVRQNSPAERAGIRPKNAVSPGDDDATVIKKVEVSGPDGKVLRFTSARSSAPDAGVEERSLDPVRLPFELQQWAKSAVGPKKVTLHVFRPKGKQARATEELTLDWDDDWRYAIETPFPTTASQSIPGLGLAYRVKTSVNEIVPGSAADRHKLQSGDIVKSVRMYTDEEFKKTESRTLSGDDWAYAFYSFAETSNPKRLELTVERSKEKKESIEVVLDDIPPDQSWPLAFRGFVFDTDFRTQRADTPLGAIAMGFDKVADTAITVYLSLKSMVSGGISFWKNANGPIAIAVTSYNVAGESFVKFVLLLSILSVNLAVLNFLPIPVLDGGHMVFLVYEWLRGRPAPEFVRTAATFAGMAMLLSLMACVIILDVKNYFFKS